MESAFKVSRPCIKKCISLGYNISRPFHSCINFTSISRSLFPQEINSITDREIYKIRFITTNSTNI